MQKKRQSPNGFLTQLYFKLYLLLYMFIPLQITPYLIEKKSTEPKIFSIMAQRIFKDSTASPKDASSFFSSTQ